MPSLDHLALELSAASSLQHALSLLAQRAPGSRLVALQSLDDGAHELQFALDREGPAALRLVARENGAVIEVELIRQSMPASQIRLVAAARSVA